MSKLNVVRRCFNCGAVLQDTDKKKKGFIESKLFETNSTTLLCKECWEQSGFNFAPKEAKVDPNYLTMLKDAKASDALIVYMVDLFSFESSFVSKFNDIIRGLNIIVIANKRDLLPADYPDERLKEYVAHRFRVAKLNVTSKDVELASLTSMTDISSLVKRILDQRKRHDVYLVGALNSGKTLFLSSFLRSYSNSTSRAVSTSYYPETNMRVMQIPLDSSSTIYDSPGISVDNSMLDKIEFDLIHDVLPSQTIEGKVHQIEKGESLFFGGLAKIDLIEGEKQNVVSYASKEVVVSKCVKSPETAFLTGISRGSLKPCSKNINNLACFDAFDITIDEKGGRDIGIGGLGWISFQGNNQTFRIFVPKGVSIYTSRAKLDYGTLTNSKR